MKILIVCNNVYMRGNGVSSAVLALGSRLAAQGVDVRFLACENPEEDGPQPDYPLRHFVFPIFEPIVEANGYRYPKIDKKVIAEAVGWADVVHLMEGFPLQAATVKIAEKMGKPCVGTYHILTENITANLGLPDNTFINKMINRWWSSTVYNHCRCVQCPTLTVKQHLEDNGYTASMTVITNGMETDDMPTLLKQPSQKPYKILCTGRLSDEKDQMTLIRAMRYSRHASEIELQFAGNGPKARKIRKAASKLVEDGIVKFEPVFGFYTSVELQELAATSWLYVHCARIEVEGLSCLEALMQGAVPVIAESRLSATSQFALDERSVFPVSDPRKLAERIDWWIEHPEERMKMGRMYADSVKCYSAKESTLKIIRMYEDALHD